MKKLILLLMLIFSCTRASGAPFNEIIFFGDSLSDNGNLYSWLMGILPKSPPYFEGRFSNGPTWAENVGRHYYEKYYIGYQIYAVGGATAIYHPPTSRFIAPTTLSIEVNKYLLDYLFQDKSETLYAIWIGGNDYIYNKNDLPEEITTKVVEQITASVKLLIKNGGNNFLLLNLPDLSTTPYAQVNDQTGLEIYSKLHNQKLTAAMESLKEVYPSVKFVFVNVFDMFNDVIADTEKYNRKYQIHITNTYGACWRGNYWFGKSIAAATVNAEIKKSWFLKNHQLPADEKLTYISNLIANSPELSYSYQLGLAAAKGVAQPCADADEYLFWDLLHPSKVVHEVLAKIAIETIDFALPG